MNDIFTMMTSRKKAMPVIDVSSIPNLSEDDRAIVGLIVARQGKNAGRLRASRPDLKEQVIIGRDGRRYREPDRTCGIAAYVWRMVAFYASPLPQHQCLPMAAGFGFDMPHYWDLSETEAEKRREADMALAKRLEDAVVSHLGVRQGSGADRWSQAILGR